MINRSDTSVKFQNVCFLLLSLNILMLPHGWLMLRRSLIVVVSHFVFACFSTHNKVGDRY